MLSSNSTTTSTSATTLSLLDHHFPPSEQLCYVHCNLCDSVLAVSVPCTSLFKSVTVRCGHCSNLLPLNMRGLLLPCFNQFLFPLSSFFSPTPSLNLPEEMPKPSPNFLVKQSNSSNHHFPMPLIPRASSHELPQPPLLDTPPGKRQKVPSAYNCFIKDEIQRIKSVNPDITHREAFSAAAKNWAHFPHINFGLMPHHAVKKTDVHQQEG